MGDVAYFRSWLSLVNHKLSQKLLWSLKLHLAVPILQILPAFSYPTQFGDTWIFRKYVIRLIMNYLPTIFTNILLFSNLITFYWS